ncbi:MAG: DUF1080 domain-containing protein [Alphaproteobacteria bacterium]|nr:DUF1080 domain-containing protein [Alphaproteobacteria bacterium]
MPAHVTHARFAAAAALLIGLAACQTKTTGESAAAPNMLTSAEKAAGWQELFDGKTLDGWRLYHADAAGAPWSVEDGAITVSGTGPDLITKDEYGDFELSVDWKISPAGNSGIIYLVKDVLEAPQTYNTGPEMQVLDDARHPDGKLPSHRAGALYDLVAPSIPAARPVGEWNTARIRVKDGHITHWLNGTKVVESPYGDDAWRKMVAGSKFKDMPLFGKASSGHIALQDHGDQVWYRNIKIRKL